MKKISSKEMIDKIVSLIEKKNKKIKKNNK